MRRASYLLFLTLVLSLMGPVGATGEFGSWESIATERSLRYRVVAKLGSRTSVTVVRLVNLPGDRSSVEGRAAASQSLLSAGYRVIELDYADDERAAFPRIAQDISKLRNDILRNGLFEDLGLDPARTFVLPEGYQLRTNVAYFQDDQRPLAMDIAYPADPDGAVPCLLEFSCDNVNRMGNFSLAVCRDALLESFATAGYAFAMADHPVAPPYKGIDPMPDCGLKVKAAVRTLRGVGRALLLSNRIGVLGFSRGSGMALLLATTDDLDQFEGSGEYLFEDSSIQAAVVLSGRFTYLNLLPEDHMWPRYIKAWGERESNLQRWKEHGALDYLDTATIPLFLSINSGEGPDAQLQMTTLRQRLAELGNDLTFVMDRDGLGHKAPIEPRILESMRFYLDSRLQDPRS